LFGIFGNAQPLERARAAELSNDEALALLPVAQQAYAQDVLNRYCVAFNVCFVEVEYLYECQANPFVREVERATGPTKVVDLTGTKTGADRDQMSGSTPVAFSLPSQVQGETDAQGLCTIRLLELLQTTHNELLAALLKSKNAPPPTDKAVAANKQTDTHSSDGKPNSYRLHWARAPGVAEPDPGSDHDDGMEHEAEEREAEEHEAEEPLAEIPPVSYLTDRRVLQRQLIQYDPQHDLVPLLSTFSVQSFASGQGAFLEYDLPRLEEALSSQLLGQGASPLAISIRHFHYMGEAHAVGLLGALSASVPQSALPVSVLDQVWVEISTRHRLTRLLTLLETIVRFVGNVGSRCVLPNLRYHSHSHLTY
jgi:hypothetical protein